MSEPRFVVEVASANFETEVIERSRRVPVVVDFWAPWCGPCRSLGPLLERLAAAYEGAFVLAKLNVDEAPELARRYGARSIPLVLGFREGQPVAEFVGAQPEATVRAFLDALLPTEADRLTEEADELAAAGHANAAEERYRAALDQDARHSRALLGLARLLAERQETAEALDLLERVLPGGLVAAEAERLAASLRTHGKAPGDESELRRRLAEDAKDLEARLALGRLLAAQDRYEEALTELLAAVKRDPAWDEEAARKLMLDLFEVLGADHQLTTRFRAELARALYR
jgi:putative thioredoxin